MDVLPQADEGAGYEGMATKVMTRCMLVQCLRNN
jgi:hypothetical protein